MKVGPVDCLWTAPFAFPSEFSAKFAEKVLSAGQSEGCGMPSPEGGARLRLCRAAAR